MASAQSLFSLDPGHISCIGGRTALTCRNCAGNAPRGSICTSCDGRGFNIFVCAHCNPAAAAASIRIGDTAASATANSTPGSSAPSSPGSLSRSPSTSYPSHSDPRTSRSWKPLGDDSRDRTGRGRIETNTPRSL
ncbi:hypothetical protein N7454_008279 [Penicillium verhagenii]|nr:hypothetical protein N7454_008279 [Penicillium verhagenii]